MKRSATDCQSKLLSFAFDAPQAEITATNEENGKIEKEIELFLSFPTPHFIMTSVRGSQAAFGPADQCAIRASIQYHWATFPKESNGLQT